MKRQDFLSPIITVTLPALGTSRIQYLCSITGKVTVTSAVRVRVLASKVYSTSTSTVILQVARATVSSTRTSIYLLRVYLAVRVYEYEYGTSTGSRYSPSKVTQYKYSVLVPYEYE